MVQNPKAVQAPEMLQTFDVAQAPEVVQVPEVVKGIVLWNMLCFNIHFIDPTVTGFLLTFCCGSVTDKKAK